MGYSERALDNPINWSFKIGRLFAIDIRVHITFIIGAIVLIAMEMPQGDAAGTVPFTTVLTRSLGTYAILFFVVLVHEFGHCYGARREGGEANEILLWPLGGLAYVQPPHEARAHMITTIAGPMVNVIFCAISAVVLIIWLGSFGAVPWNPLYLASPVDSTIFPTTAQMWVMRFFGISYFLLLINLLPIFPFDGGRIVQAWLWPRKGYRSSMEIATGTGMVGAIIVGLFGLLTGEWLVMMIAVFGYLTCWQNRRVLREQGEFETGFGVDYGDGYTFGKDDDKPARKPGYFERRRAKKAALRAEWERAQREAHDKAVEEALKQVSISGLESLTPQQRRLLEQETERRRAVDQGCADDNG